jgi:hypothetical protein
MARYSIFFIAVLFLIFASGCATTIGGKAPSFDAEKSATLSGQEMHKNLWHGEQYRVFMINDQKIKWGFFKNQIDFKFPIALGKNTLVVKSLLNAGFGGPYTALTDLSFEAASGHSYVINGKVENGFVFTWIEDSETKTIVSEVGKTRYVTLQPSMIPIMTLGIAYIMIP